MASDLVLGSLDLFPAAYVESYDRASTLGCLRRRAARPFPREGSRGQRGACEPGGERAAQRFSLERTRPRPWRKRHDSDPVSMMCARWVTRSTTALARRASGKTLPHSPKGTGWCDDERPSLVALGDALEDELSGSGQQREVAELVEHEQLDAHIAADDARQLAARVGLDQLVGKGAERRDFRRHSVPMLGRWGRSASPSALVRCVENPMPPDATAPDSACHWRAGPAGRFRAASRGLTVRASRVPPAARSAGPGKRAER